MQDIGGCRAILPDIAACYKVQARLRKRNGFDREVDYIDKPKSSGYRGIHVIVKYDERRIEVQLRTRAMHEWAIAVERLGFRMGDELKSGGGPAEVTLWLLFVSQAMAIEEVGDAVPDGMLEQLNTARQDALPFLS
jgi:putative GTP pyrophosphokinase